MTYSRRCRDVVAVLVLVVVASGCSEPAPTFTEEHRKLVIDELRLKGYERPVSLEQRSDGFVVADFEVEGTRRKPARTFGEERLLAIRNALYGYGFKDFRVNINGPSPGPGLTSRYGSARLMEPGTLEWLPPPN